MAIGCARTLGYELQRNFDLPYVSRNVSEFWKRWHISLSSWLQQYLYIPLGGNRRGRARTYLNLMLTMVLGGLWHGAGANFVLWGALHGAALVVHKAWRRAHPQQRGGAARWLSTLLTFAFVCLCWVFFRAQTTHAGGAGAAEAVRLDGRRPARVQLVAAVAGLPAGRDGVVRALPPRCRRHRPRRDAAIPRGHVLRRVRHDAARRADARDDVHRREPVHLLSVLTRGEAGAFPDHRVRAARVGRRTLEGADGMYSYGKTTPPPPQEPLPQGAQPPRGRAG